MSEKPFTLEPSPADPQPVRVYQLDDCTWWAGYSLRQCIEQARAEHGDDCYEDAEQEGHQATAEEMQRLTFVDDMDDPKSVKRSFDEELQQRIASGAQFPQMFACSEY